MMSPHDKVFDLSSTPLEPGVTMIEASAGTGKTFCLTGIVLRLIVEAKIDDVGQILVMTFTNAATQELVERVRKRLREALAVFSHRASGAPDGLAAQLLETHGDAGRTRLENALLDLDRIEISTIHGFCKRVLEQNAFESGVPFDVGYIEDDAPLLARAAQDFWRETIYGAGPLVAAAAVHSKWQPDSFIEDYKKYRLHLDVEIRPTPASIEQAIRGLEAAARAVGDAWHREEPIGVLRSVRHKASSRLHGERLEPGLAAVAEFCSGRHPERLYAVLDLCAAGLAEKVYQKDLGMIEGLEFFHSCDALTAAIDTLEHALRCAFIHRVGHLFEREKRAQARIGFDDLLHRLRDALNDPGRGPALTAALGARYHAVLVDEFQDTDEIQYDIFRRLFSDRILVFVGDPKQAIYRFRGADVFAYLRAKRDARRQYTLNRNWRSTAPLVEALNETFAAVDDPFVLAGIPFHRAVAQRKSGQERLAGDERKPLVWTWLAGDGRKDELRSRACDLVRDEIARLLAEPMRLGDRRLGAGDIAVLVRQNQDARRLQTNLAGAGIHAVISQSGNIFESEEFGELHALARGVLRPGDETAVRAAMSTRAWGRNAVELSALDEGDWQTTTAELEELRDTWRSRGFVTAMHRLIAYRSVRARLLSASGGARRLTNFLHAIDVVHRHSAEEHLGPESTLAWIARARAELAASPSEASELRLESDDDAVRIVTVHKSKGLEYEIVFCPFLWDGPTRTRNEPVLVHLDDATVYECRPDEERDEAVRSAAQAEELAEEARLAYVALTRARERCYVTFGPLAGAENTAIARLLGRPKEQWRERVGAMCDEHPDAMQLLDPSEERPISYAGAGAIAHRELLSALPFPAERRPNLVPWRIASFSSMRVAPTEARTRPIETPDYADPSLPSVDDAVPAGIFAFARGARAGSCLHEILEHVDFQRTGASQTRELVERTLQLHGLDGGHAHHAPGFDPTVAVLDMLDKLVRAPLPRAGFAFRDVARASRLAEWQFYTPVAKLSVAGVAEVLARHGEGFVGGRYAAKLAETRHTGLDGFLNGFVDLVFEHDGGWYVVDWKSNHLGNRTADYDEQAIQRSMDEHDYILQYHLYVLALHRYLRHRVRGYDYDRHVRGVYYGYLRGIDSRGTSGWYFDRPSRALVEALDAALAVPEAS